jgi:hypothetical protein
MQRPWDQPKIDLNNDQKITNEEFPPAIKALLVRLGKPIPCAFEFIRAIRDYVSSQTNATGRRVARTRHQLPPPTRNKPNNCQDQELRNAEVQCDSRKEVQFE